MTLLDGGALRGGIGFSLGDTAEQGLERVDVLFTPERNEYMGRVTPQLSIRAIRPAEGSASLPDEDAFFHAILQEITHLAENFNKIQVAEAEMDVLNETAVRKLMQSGRGTLLIAHGRERAAAFAVEGRVDVCAGRAADNRAFSTLLCGVDIDALRDVWRDIVLLDGDLLPGEKEAIRAKCPRARLHRMKKNPVVQQLLDQLRMDDETLRGLYRALRAGQTQLAALAAATGLTRAQVLVGLTAFSQVKLAEVSLSPYAVHLLPPVKCRMDDSALIRYLRA